MPSCHSCRHNTKAHDPSNKSRDHKLRTFVGIARTRNRAKAGFKEITNFFLIVLILIKEQDAVNGVSKFSITQFYRSFVQD
jgi:hypothetical protein